jgi:O-antigen ligase
MLPVSSVGKDRVIQFSPALQRTALVVAVLILLTSSFDIFLVANAGGNYRFCQIVAPLLIALATVKAVWGSPVPTLGLLPLSIWFAAQVFFIPAASFWPKSVGYCFWLFLNIGLMFAFVQLFSHRRAALLTLLRWYLYSFGLVAAFGIVQFLLPLFGLPALLVEQWWIPGLLPRANGFSYEPSYFATYLLIGFVFVSSLRRARSSLLSGRVMLLIYALTALGIIVSSSRMGIIFLLIDVFLSQVRPWRSIVGDIAKSRIVPSKIRALVPSLLLTALLVSILGGAVMALQNRPALMLIFLNGTGLDNTAAHSVIERADSLEETIAVFVNHPIIGQSLGGVSSAIADQEGESVHSFEDSKKFEGMSIFAEILAASGIIGAVPFVSFLVITIWKPLALARRTGTLYSALLVAAVRSLVFAWAILQFNQNVLRPYLWVHLAVLVTIYAAARDSAAPARKLHTPSR